ncbi:hypothetical protein BH10PLA1_BH10PLA1_11380 [soil metagenome]
MRMSRWTNVQLLTVLLASLLTGCTKYDALDLLIPPIPYWRTRNLAYGRLARQKLDVYQPWQQKPNAKVVVFFYGGEWQAGEKAGYRFVAQGLASRGFIVVIPDYRYYPEVTFPGFVEDCALSVKWTHDNIAKYGGDPTHVFLVGHSAGAHIAALLNFDDHYLRDVGLDSHAIRATAALSGPYDFMPWEEDRGIFNMSRTDTKPNPQIEPINFVTPHAPPILLLHGLQDEVVSVGNVRRMAAQIAAAGGKVNTIIYPDRAHVTIAMALAFPFRWLAPVLDDTVAYLNSQ